MEINKIGIRYTINFFRKTYLQNLRKIEAQNKGLSTMAYCTSLTIHEDARNRFMVYTWDRCQQECESPIIERHFDGHIYSIFSFEDGSMIRFLAEENGDGSFSPCLDEDMEVLEPMEGLE